jgi:hypothetical protein
VFRTGLDPGTQYSMDSYGSGFGSATLDVQYVPASNVVKNHFKILNPKFKEETFLYVHKKSQFQFEKQYRIRVSYGIRLKYGVPN